MRASPCIGGKPVRFELVAEDDQADPKTGTIVAQRLVDAGIRGMVGHFNSGVTIPRRASTTTPALPQLSVSTNPKYTRQGYATAFRVMADDDRQGARARRIRGAATRAEEPRRRGRSHRIRAGSRRRIRSRGQERARRSVKREYVSDKDFDFRAVLTLIKSAKPQAIFFAGYDAQAGPLARQMKELGMDALLLGGETMNTAKFLELAGPAAEGHVASTPGAALARSARTVRRSRSAIAAATSRRSGSTRLTSTTA